MILPQILRDHILHTVQQDLCDENSLFNQEIWGIIERAASLRRQCPICNEWFSPTRTDARYCTDACRFRAYRKRKKKTES